MLLTSVHCHISLCPHVAFLHQHTFYFVGQVVIIHAYCWPLALLTTDTQREIELPPSLPLLFFSVINAMWNLKQVNYENTFSWNTEINPDLNT